MKYTIREMTAQEYPLLDDFYTKPFLFQKE